MEIGHRPSWSDVLVTRPGRGDVKRCLEFMEADSHVRGRRVLIKPNLTVNLPAETGVTTHPYLFREAAEYLLDVGAREVVLGEGRAGRVMPAFKDQGFVDLATDLGIREVDFWDDEAVEVRVPNPLVVDTFRIAKTALHCDVILNLPVMKIHVGESRVTLCAKNMMGCIWGDKSFMHTDFNLKIVDLLKEVRPHLNIVDGIVGMERREIGGRPVGSNVLVAGVDFVAVDAVSSWIMGFKPMEVEHIALAERHGFGWARPEKIKIHGLSVEDVARPFERASQ